MVNLQWLSQDLILYTKLFLILNLIMLMHILNFSMLWLDPFYAMQRKFGDLFKVIALRNYSVFLLKNFLSYLTIHQIICFYLKRVETPFFCLLLNCTGRLFFIH